MHVVALAQKRLGPFSALRCYEATVEFEPQHRHLSCEYALWLRPVKILFWGWKSC